MGCGPKGASTRWLVVVVVSLVAALGAGVADGQEAEGRPAALEALDGYTGHWRSEDKTGPEGTTFHFEYELRWLDPGRTIAELSVTRVAPEATTVVFEGYKGLDPAGGVYYFGASPSGRGARGNVVIEGDDLVTLYDGWTADGDVVEIRDVFGPLNQSGNAFVSRTYLRPDPGAEWRQIGEDHWRRLER